ncbi:hypothetical protein FRC06_011697 [Ceratobasidium sp. 370]|nr:hypothetical protein FRC06_011697 [Ceratobasidium sp. 370]
MPTVTAEPPLPASTGRAETVPGTLPVPALTAVPPQVSPAPAPKPVAALSTSNASVPALNSGSSSGVPATPTSSTIAQKSMTARASDGNPAADATGPAPLKLMLERLHRHGIDCVDIVRRAADAAGAPTDLLRQPSAGIGGTGGPTPLFAPGQPLEIWTQNLKVSRAQGEAIVKHIWMISRDKMRKIGLDPVTGQPVGQTGETGQQGGGRSANFTDSTGSIGPATDGLARNSAPLVGPDAPTTGSNVNLASQAQGRPPVSQDKPHIQARAPASVVPSAPASTTSTVYDHPAIPFIQRTTMAGPLPPQPTFNVPAVQSAPVIHPHGPQAPPQAYNPAVAEHHRLGLHPTQQPRGHPAQHSYQSHPLYQRPGVQASFQPQAPPMQESQPAPKAPKATNPVPKPPKGGGTPALDFLRSLGIMPTAGPPSRASSDAGGETSKERRKEKGKAKAVDEVSSTSIVAVEKSPAAQLPAIQLPATQQEDPVDKGGVSLVQTNQPTLESATPIIGIESHTVNAETLEPPPQLDRPVTPPSPLLVPTITVLQEPGSPSTTGSPLPEPVVDPGSVLEHEDTPQPVVEAPESIQAAQLVVTPAPASTSSFAPAPATSPTPGPAPDPIQTPTPAPSPGPAQLPPLSPVSSVAPPALVPDAQMADPLVPDLPRSPSLPPPSVTAMSISSPPHPPSSVPRPASSASQRPPAPTEYAPLKRKRDSGSSPGLAPEPSGGVKESWAVAYARAANQLSESNKAKKARSEQSMAARSEPRASASGVERGSATTQVQDKGKGKALFRPETPPSRMPLFRPETPPSNSQGEDTDIDIDVVGDVEPIATPRSVPPRPRPSTSKGKRRMIMEVVLPLRKGAKPQPRAKAAAGV